MGILGVLQVIFIVLKCLGLIDWTWPQVFIPMFIGLALIAIVLLVVLIIFWRSSKHGRF